MLVLLVFGVFFSLCAEFFPSLKRLLGTPVYCLFLCGSILRFNSIIGQITYTPKYMEQQFGVSTTRANFLLGKFKCHNLADLQSGEPHSQHGPLVAWSNITPNTIIRLIQYSVLSSAPSLPPSGRGENSSLAMTTANFTYC